MSKGTVPVRISPANKLLVNEDLREVIIIYKRGNDSFQIINILSRIVTPGA